MPAIEEPITAACKYTSLEYVSALFDIVISPFAPAMQPAIQRDAIFLISWSNHARRAFSFALFLSTQNPCSRRALRNRRRLVNFACKCQTTRLATRDRELERAFGGGFSLVRARTRWANRSRSVCGISVLLLLCTYTPKGISMRSTSLAVGLTLKLLHLLSSAKLYFLPLCHGVLRARLFTFRINSTPDKPYLGSFILFCVL